MDIAQTVTSVLGLIAGVGVFLIACNMMSSNLEALGSRRLKRLFAKTSQNKFVGVGVGAAATAAIQSSSATTVMVIGFVNAGIMTLAQAATVIFGANIGTTVTGQLVALGMFGSSVSTSVIFAALAGVGAFMCTFAKKDATQKAGGITAGFGMLFAGLDMMSGSMGYFAALDSVKNFLSMFGNPLLLVLTGALVTALVQSSSVMTSMTITMVVTGLISLDQGVYLTMGANVGTCVTALIAGLTSTVNAKRTALIHLIFNIGGVAVFLIAGLVMSVFGVNYGGLFAKMFPHAPQMQLAMFHTIFNVITVAVILPLTNPLVKAVTKMIPDKKTAGENTLTLKFAEEHMLKMPPVAVRQTKREILGMADIAMENFEIACDIICTLDYGKIEIFRSNENRLDFINAELANFMAKLLKSELGENDRVYLSTAFRSVTDLERVGDYAENIVEYADKLKESNSRFSSEAVGEIKELKSLVKELFERVITAYSDRNAKALREAYAIEERVDKMTVEMTEKHVERMQRGVCSPEVGTQYLSFFANTERVADHYINVAKTINALQSK